MPKPKTTTWSLDPQTRAKHEILRTYLGGWFAVMGHTMQRILFLDAFAGPGEYIDGSPGSPIIALETILHHSVVNTSCEFLLLFNESDLGRYSHLLEVLARAEVATPLPSNVKVITQNQKFMDLSADISSHFQDAQSNLAPTLAFIDPFGVSDSPLVALNALLGFPKCEVFTYLSLMAINRFASAGQIDHQMEALFGTDAFKFAPAAGDPTRMPYFVELYEEQLKLTCDFKYTLSFRMRNRQGQMIYALVFATRNLKGLELMKGAMWKVAPDGSFSFSARNSNMEALFELGVDYQLLANAIESRFPGRKVYIDTVEEFVLIHTPFLKTHVRRSLSLLENDKRIAVQVPAGIRRRAGTFPAGMPIQFLQLSTRPSR